MEPKKPDGSGKIIAGCLLGAALFMLVVLLIGYGVCSYELKHMGTR